MARSWKQASVVRRYFVTDGYRVDYYDQSPAKDPKAKAPWYNGTGVLMYIIGMMVSAFALRGLEVLP